MLMQNKNNLTAASEKTWFGLTGRRVFRLAAILCLITIINPGQYIKKQKEYPIDEHGIGGGYFFEEHISEEEAGIVLTPASLESPLESENISKSRVLLYDSHVMQRGDVIGSLAVRYGLNQDTIISVNKISASRSIQAGRVLRIPNQDGIFHNVKNGETLSSLAARYKVEIEDLQIVNELFSDFVVTGTDLFIPGARLDREVLQYINGDLFIWPVYGTITSNYGWRTDPFNRSRRHFHNGIDIRASTGTPVRATMAGRVHSVGFDRILGNYVIINHNAGYRTLYAHLSVIRVRTGAYVAAGGRIGDVGNTGQSTGPHLHFTVFRNGVTVNPRTILR
ncbi:MAG: M23 family metallopeptidase [Treponema sp.]|nr:M23 family metallopeptidase [Treponema sp.]